MNPNLLNDLPEPAKSYWKRADEFLAKNSVGWESVAVGSPEYGEWVNYFKYLGFRPRMIAMAEMKTIQTIVVPTRHPEWFDPKFAASD